MKQAGMFTGALLLAGLVPAAAGQGHVETFTGGSNVGAWTFGNAFDAIEAAGGNPGAYLHNPNVDTFAPQPRTGAGVVSAFTGDYRARGVVSVGVDLRTLSTQFTFSRPLSVILENDSGTPNDPNDDCSVYFVSSDLVPQPAEGWRSFDFVIPSQSATMPPGWDVLNPNGACTGDAAWNAVITDVDRVRFFYGDPTFFFLFDIWDVGIDNPRIGEGIGTASCFGDGSAAACPCGNGGGPGEGCASSTGSGGKLAASGTTSVAANDQVFTATQLRPNALSILLQGDTAIGAVAFGDGLRCVGGTLKRLGTQQASAAGTVSFGPGLAGVGGWNAGATYGFQAYYRDPLGPCGANFNATHALSIGFVP